MLALYLPAAQLVQDDCAAIAYFPAPQRVCATPLQELPALQAVQTEDAQYWPGLQAVAGQGGG
jgi:hypothetical protein